MSEKVCDTFRTLIEDTTHHMGISPGPKSSLKSSRVLALGDLDLHDNEPLVVCKPEERTLLECARLKLCHLRLGRFARALRPRRTPHCSRAWRMALARGFGDVGGTFNEETPVGARDDSVPAKWDIRGQALLKWQSPDAEYHQTLLRLVHKFNLDAGHYGIGGAKTDIKLFIYPSAVLRRIYSAVTIQSVWRSHRERVRINITRKVLIFRATVRIVRWW
eukprot:845592_1